MRDAARVGVFLSNAQADDKTAFRIAPVEQRPDRLEEGAGAEQRLEAVRRIGLAHRVIPKSMQYRTKSSAGALTLALSLAISASPGTSGLFVSRPDERNDNFERRTGRAAPPPAVPRLASGHARGRPNHR